MAVMTGIKQFRADFEASVQQSRVSKMGRARQSLYPAARIVPKLGDRHGKDD